MSQADNHRKRRQRNTNRRKIEFKKIIQVTYQLVFGEVLCKEITGEKKAEESKND